MSDSEPAGESPAPAAAAAAEPVVKVKRHTIDIILISLGIVATIVFAVAGALLLWGHNFASDWVHDELSSQNIFFPDAESLSGQGRDDLVKYAGEQVDTGDEAEAYASFIDGHLQGIADGQTYAEMGATVTEAQNALQEAQDGDATEEEIAELQQEVDTLNAQRDSLFKGETLRGLLLSAYAWSTIGTIAGIAAVVAFVAAGVMLVLVIAGLIHLGRRPA